MHEIVKKIGKVFFFFVDKIEDFKVGMEKSSIINATI